MRKLIITVDSGLSFLIFLTWIGVAVAAAPQCHDSPFHLGDPHSAAVPLGQASDFIDSGVVAVGELHMAILWFRVPRVRPAL